MMFLREKGTQRDDLLFSIVQLDQLKLASQTAFPLFTSPSTHGLLTHVNIPVAPKSLSQKRSVSEL